MTADPSPDPMTSSYLKRPDAQGHLKVLEVLRKWDPIGVMSDPTWPRDEYDSYAPEMIRMLDAGIPKNKMVAHLGKIATEYMGLSSYDKKHTSDCVQELIDFWLIWKSR